MNRESAWRYLIGKRGKDADMKWWARLTALGELLDELTAWREAERARLAAKWHRDGYSFAVIAERTGLTRSGAQKLVERGRKLLADSQEDAMTIGAQHEREMRRRVMSNRTMVSHEPAWESADLLIDRDGNTRPGWVCVHPLENGNGLCGSTVFRIAEAVGEHSCVVTGSQEGLSADDESRPERNP